jgi:hypothetical protein
VGRKAQSYLNLSGNRQKYGHDIASVYLTTFFQLRSRQNRASNGRMVVNRELERIPKEVITTYRYSVTPDCTEDTEKKKL